MSKLNPNLTENFHSKHQGMRVIYLSLGQLALALKLLMMLWRISLSTDSNLSSADFICLKVQSFGT